MANLNLLTEKRKLTRKSVTSEFNKIKQNRPSSPVEILRIKSLVEDYEQDLSSLNAEIQNLKFSEQLDADLYEQEHNLCNEYKSKCKEIIAILSTPATSNDAPTQNSLPNHVDESKSLLMRATAPLPSFNSKEDEDLASFFAQLENALNKHQYSDYDKLQLLRQQISGNALTLIESLEPDEESYDVAKGLLMNALASPEIQKAKLIKKLSELFPVSDFDPYAYIGEMRTVIRKAKKIGLSLDDVFQFFFWRGLNDEFQNTLRDITHKSRPALEDLSDDNMFQAADRYLLSKRKPQGKPKGENRVTSSFAANVSTVKCILCLKNSKDASHPIFKCPNFPDPQTKLKEIKRFHLCCKCANEHPTSECRFRFRSACRKCNQYHFSYLCQQNSENGVKNKNFHPKNRNGGNHNQNTEGGQSEDEDQISTTSSLVTVSASALKACLHHKTILPTFTAYTKGKEIRILKDGGCQSNFISHKTAKRLNLKVIKNKINLTVNGINKKQNYHSKLVEIPLKLDNREYVIEALCIPNLSIALELPDLPHIVEAFLDKGYNLADQRLTNCNSKIDDIELILGSKSTFCIPESDVLLGSQSLYANTPIGIILKGDCEQILKDLIYLPHYKETESTKMPNLSINAHSMTTHSETKSHAKLENDCGVMNTWDGYGVLDDSGEVKEFGKVIEDKVEINCRYLNLLDMNECEKSTTEVNERNAHSIKRPTLAEYKNYHKHLYSRISM